ncbi:unnamed protein product [Caenorhabditis auriculariae]|uniref:Uncharacterized protein n=1 Tax=Caenorhabditis auriculariae TaxID=2777116 RepID=A0A8S1H226_9PELO|nr:unnamed protein product [Caenorhabditis auriculariae]
MTNWEVLIETLGRGLPTTQRTAAKAQKRRGMGAGRGGSERVCTRRRTADGEPVPLAHRQLATSSAANEKKTKQGHRMRANTTSSKGHPRLRKLSECPLDGGLASSGFK